ncbi:MAG: RNase adapter RapZ [Candidatus Methylomirabilia bacterium]
MKTPARRGGTRRKPAAKPAETEFLVITGLSGSGRSSAVKAFEDMGAYCVDNLPTDLLPQMLELTHRSTLELDFVVLGMDIRERGFVRHFPRIYRAARARGIRIRLLFLEASENVLVRRFSETRRVHALGAGIPLVEAIRQERRELESLRDLADQIVDTSAMSIRELRERMLSIAHEVRSDGSLIVTIISFGFKYGVPAEADLVFDVRFIRNPFFEEGLKHLCGLDDPVRDFVLGRPETAAFLGEFLPFLSFLIPFYRVDSRAYLTIAIGCTGGRHRSPVIARAAAEALAGPDLRVTMRDRDIQGDQRASPA